MQYILQTNYLTKIIDGRELVKNVNIHVRVSCFLRPFERQGKPVASL